MEYQRNVTLDVAKGLTLLTLPVIHSTLFFSGTNVHQSAFGQALAFVAEAAAPSFMLTMGIAVSLSRPKTRRQISIRFVRLLLLGYLLNALKFLVPQIWNGLPESIFTENGLTPDIDGSLQLLFIGDILQLAAISYFVCALLYRI